MEFHDKRYRVGRTRHHSLVELRDALVTVGALIAHADGRVDPFERKRMVHVMEHNGLLSVFTPGEIVEAFRHRVRQISTHGSKAAVDELGRFAGSVAARLLIDTAERMADADGFLDPQEREVLQLIQTVLGERAARPMDHQGRAR